jgi:hypothetical protein
LGQHQQCRCQREHSHRKIFLHYPVTPLERYFETASYQVTTSQCFYANSLRESIACHPTYRPTLRRQFTTFG